MWARVAGGRLRRRAVVGGALMAVVSAAGIGAVTRGVPHQYPFSVAPYPQIGILWGVGLRLDSPPAQLQASAPLFAALLQGLHEYGWIHGQTANLELRDFFVRTEPIDQLATELTQLPVDILVASTVPAALAAKKATSTIPIVFVNISDPVDAGLVSSLARPGGNITGLSLFDRPLTSKRLELLEYLVPGLTRVGVFTDSRNPATVATLGVAQASALTLGLAVQPLEIRGPESLNAVANAMAREDVQALLDPSITALTSYKAAVVQFETQVHLPIVHADRAYVELGGLMAYGPNRSAINRRTGWYVDRILRGAMAADLPIEQPTTFEFVVNVKTAQTLGLTFSPDIAAQVTDWVH
jgi:putative tryptophan/tyrosine transport system substrate-binding protein